MPRKSSTVEPPRSRSAASCQDIAASVRRPRRRRRAARASHGASRCMRNRNSIAEQREGDRQRREQPPFRRDQRLDRERAGRDSSAATPRAVPDEIEAADEAEQRRRPIRVPGERARQRAKHDVDADVLPLAQQPGRGEQSRDRGSPSEISALQPGSPPGADVAQSTSAPITSVMTTDQRSGEHHERRGRGRRRATAARHRCGHGGAAELGCHLENNSFSFGPCSGLCLIDAGPAGLVGLLAQASAGRLRAGSPGCRRSSASPLSAAFSFATSA